MNPNIPADDDDDDYAYAYAYTLLAVVLVLLCACIFVLPLVNDINIVLTWSLLGIMHWWYSTVQDYTISRYGGIIIICIIAKSPNLSLGKSK